MRRKAILLYSGGLDSLLAGKICLNFNLDLYPIFFYTLFLPRRPKPYISELGVDLKIYDVSEDFLKVVKNPLYGYGKNINPCIDCKIFMFKLAKELMKLFKADFIISGEVLGERPMSQRKNIFNLIEREAGLEGLILRPLSAKLLKPTIAEENNWVKRDKLFAIQGKSRKPQFELARQLGIKNLPSPSGGCLLTDPCFSRRLKDLMNVQPDFGIADVLLLKIGRHFRLSAQVKLIVGRDEKENQQLLLLHEKKYVLLKPLNVKGPVGLISGENWEEKKNLISNIFASYCNPDGEERIKLIFIKDKIKFIQEGRKMEKAKFASWLI